MGPSRDKGFEWGTDTFIGRKSKGKHLKEGDEKQKTGESGSLARGHPWLSGLFPGRRIPQSARVVPRLKDTFSMAERHSCWSNLPLFPFFFCLFYSTCLIAHVEVECLHIFLHLTYLRCHSIIFSTNLSISTINLFRIVILPLSHCHVLYLLMPYVRFKFYSCLHSML